MLEQQEENIPNPDVWQRIWEGVDCTVEKDIGLIEYEWKSIRWRRTWRTIIGKKFLPPKENWSDLQIIELGAGIGDASLMLAKRFGASVTLVDINTLALQKSFRRFEAHDILVNTIKLDLLNSIPANLQDSYDISVSLGVAEHFDGRERHEVIERHFSVLKPGGFTIINVPNKFSWPYRYWKRKLENESRWPYGFEKPFSSRELKRAAKEIGFTQMEVFGSSFYEALSKYLLGDRPRLRRTLSFLLRDNYQRETFLNDLWGYNLILIAQK